MSSDEWNRLLSFTRLLAIFDDAQQEFSADGYPSLHLVLPALEKLHENLGKRLDDPAYAPFAAAIQASLNVIEEYYSRTEYSDAYIICSGKLQSNLGLSWVLTRCTMWQFLILRRRCPGLTKNGIVTLGHKHGNLFVASSKNDMTRCMAQMVLHRLQPRRRRRAPRCGVSYRILTVSHRPYHRPRLRHFRLGKSASTIILCFLAILSLLTAV
ncbi:hypothetical protein EV421DRAFT_335347 [Armillaria borealis]|uniref:Uncharacterized protein n=1 Tax=Armillaria borealis TaxID=47425 RepID=A0AA39MDW8_9AGAR|nr:hypothetical protein EV421DRAFT_335347 [Armillaria borealis]